MKKVFVSLKTNEEERKQLEALKNYSFVYQKELDADIIVGNVKANELKEYHNLKWLQLSSVGYDAYIKNNVLNDDVILTNAVDVHSLEVSEHILALMLSLVKNLPLYRDNQRKHLWHDEGVVKQISELKVSIIGMGSIGKKLAALLKGLGVYVIGVKRNINMNILNVDKLYASEDLKEAIKDVDVVVSVLPGVKENEYLFDLDTFKAMKPDTIFINAGRGNLYQEEVLFEVLSKKIISFAASDVFEKEPLDKNSKLWDLDNFVVTPHVAGYFHLASARRAFFDLVIDNLKRFENNEKLLNIVSERE